MRTKVISHFQSVAASRVEPVLKDHPTGHKNVVCQDRWSLVTLRFCHKYLCGL